MTATSLVGLNLLLNAITAFLFAAAVAWGAQGLFRLRGAAAIAVAFLPFAKVAWETARGVPDRSFVWQRARGVAPDFGSFQMGLGVDWGVPRLHMTLDAHAGGAAYSQSAADFIAVAISRFVGAWAPAVVLVLLLAVAAAKIAARLHAWRGEVADRRALGAPAAFARVLGRSVPVYLVASGDGAFHATLGAKSLGRGGAPHASPHAGGLLRPYVVFPRAAWDALDDEERTAALQHELGHVAQAHVLWLALASLLSDLFWFVPGSRGAHDRLRDACEHAADRWALERGVDPVVLASALVRVRELTVSGGGAHVDAAADLTAAHLAARRGLAARVQELLDERPPRRWLDRPWVRLASTVWVAAIVLGGVAFGNH